MGPGRIHDFMVGGDHGTVRSILSSKSLNDLIGSLSSLGINHLHSRTVLPLLRWLPLLPPIKYDGNVMVFAVSVTRQVTQQLLASGFKVSGKRSPARQKVIPINNQVRRHTSRYHSPQPTVTVDLVDPTRVVLDKATDI